MPFKIFVVLAGRQRVVAVAVAGADPRAAPPPRHRNAAGGGVPRRGQRPFDDSAAVMALGAGRRGLGVAGTWPGGSVARRLEDNWRSCPTPPRPVRRADRRPRRWPQATVAGWRRCSPPPSRPARPVRTRHDRETFAVARALVRGPLALRADGAGGVAIRHQRAAVSVRRALTGRTPAATSTCPTPWASSPWPSAAGTGSAWTSNACRGPSPTTSPNAISLPRRSVTCAGSRRPTRPAPFFDSLDTEGGVN